MLSVRCSAGPWSPSGCQGGPGERREKGDGVAQVKHMMLGAELVVRVQ